MQLLVKLLRRRGVLIPREEVDAAPWVAVSVLTDSHRVSGRRLAMFRAGHGGMPGSDGAVRELFGVSVREVCADHMIVRGIERSKGPNGEPAAVVQEWMMKPRPESGGAGLLHSHANEYTRDPGALVSHP